MNTTQNPINHHARHFPTACLSCQYVELEARTGFPMLPREKAHVMLWGCTCDAKVAAEAQAHMDRITR